VRAVLCSTLIDLLDRQPHSVVISCVPPLGIDALLRAIWRYLGLVRIYTKPRGEAPDLEEPIILTAGRHGLTVRAACLQIHRALLNSFKYAIVWGTR
jgi:ribosome-interacting GTPase 1